MSILPGEGAPSREPRIDDRYLYDGLIRRRLHEFGRLGINFYDLAVKRLGCGPGDIVMDIGAGMGDDGGNIAWEYRPRIVFLVEPAGRNSPDYDDRYLSLATDLHGREFSGVQLLASESLDTTLQELHKPHSSLLRRSTTYIQPVPTIAEDLPPRLENSVTKLSMIHSIYEFGDVFEAMRQTVKVMTPAATGLVITNGPDDKTVFKEILQKVKQEFDRESPEGVEYITPQTVSSKLNYLQAEDLLRQFFEHVELYTYRDEMLITPERMPVYEWALNSYRRYFKPPIINDGRWNRAKDIVLRERGKEDDQGVVIRDTIDIGAIYFWGPKK